MLDGYQIVDRFAKALDAEDYTAAASLLGDECEYTCRGARHRGPSAIIASYRGNGEAANSFDSVEYESDVVAESAWRFRIKFVDHLSHAGGKFTFRCEQIVELNRSGEIVRIDHFDLPGQTDALAEFKKRLADPDPPQPPISETD